MYKLPSQIDSDYDTAFAAFNKSRGDNTLSCTTLPGEDIIKKYAFDTSEGITSIVTDVSQFIISLSVQFYGHFSTISTQLELLFQLFWYYVFELQGFGLIFFNKEFLEHLNMQKSNPYESWFWKGFSCVKYSFYFLPDVKFCCLVRFFV